MLYSLGSGLESALPGDCCVQLGSSNPQGTWGVVSPRLPTGDGEAISRSAPLEGWSSSFAYLQVLRIRLLRARCAPTPPATGEGEHLSPLLSPLGGLTWGLGQSPSIRAVSLLRLCLSILVGGRLS